MNTAPYTNTYKNPTMNIVTQAPPTEPNPELWLKQQEYNWICKLGTLNKTSQKGLNNYQKPETLMHNNAKYRCRVIPPYTELIIIIQ